MRTLAEYHDTVRAALTAIPGRTAPVVDVLDDLPQVGPAYVLIAPEFTQPPEHTMPVQPDGGLPDGMLAVTVNVRVLGLGMRQLVALVDAALPSLAPLGILHGQPGTAPYDPDVDTPAYLITVEMP